jgi:hypothetical protein
MADLQFTGEFGLNTSVELRDDSPLAKSKLTHLASITQALKHVDKPIDQHPERSQAGELGDVGAGKELLQLRWHSRQFRPEE